jgi:hypothetical protein
VTYARTLYEYKEFSDFGDYGDDRSVEDYTTQIQGEPTGVIPRSPATRPETHSTSWSTPKKKIGPAS